MVEPVYPAGHDEQAREDLRQLTVERVRDMVRATPPNPEGKVAPAESSAEPSDLVPWVRRNSTDSAQ